jgi:hypothetical protein
MKAADPIYICVPFLQHAVGKYLTENFSDFQRHKKVVGEQMCRYGGFFVFFRFFNIYIRVLGNLFMLRNWTKLSSSLQQAFGWEPINPAGSMYGT